ncbi:MAG: flippase, partial [Desulfobulbaceae bacterium]|nr:flippase [Desulfobulbaceae bacterium]
MEQPTITHLRRNIIINTVGQGLPLLVGVFAIPSLIRGLGVDRFGLLNLVWMVVGYFSLFDLGLGQALTKLVAQRLGEGEEGEIPRLIQTSLILMAGFGGLGAMVAGGATGWLVHEALKIPAKFQEEARQSFYLLSLSIPLVVTTSGLRGVLEAYGRFGTVNAVRIPMGIFSFLAPLAVLPFTDSLYPVVAVLVAGRLLAWFVHLVLCIRLVPGLSRGRGFHRSLLRPLLSFGGWMTVSNIVSPLMVYVDRFLIGAFISMAAVAYYTTPYEVITKVWIIPAGLVGVIFPAFSSWFGQERQKTAELFAQGVKYLFVLVFPIILVVVVFAGEGLSLWLGGAFALQSKAVLQWLAVGVLVNCLAHVPFVLLQGAGRPDLVAKMHVAELFVYLPALWLLLPVFGIKGAAMAWAGRVLLDAIILFVMACRLVPEVSAFVRRAAGHGGVVTVVVLGAAAMIAGLWVKLLFVGGVIFVFGIWGWKL